MNWLQIFILGLISGFTEFLPLSASGHQKLMMHLFGRTEIDPLCRFMLTLGSFAALLSACSVPLRRIMLYRRLSARRTLTHNYESLRYDIRIIKTVAVMVCASYTVFTLFQIPVQLPWLVFAFGVNGVILFVMGNMRQANKSSRHMTGLDTLVIGLSGCASVIPGISLVGTVTSTAIVCGMQRQTALSLSLLICVPVMLIQMLVDLILLLIAGTTLSLPDFFCCFGGAFLAYVGGLISIRFVRFAVNKSGLSGFSYYAWGASLLTFILFLIT